MYKVLIADDEALSIRNMLSLIPWEQHGFTIVGTATNGRQALKLVQTHHPDLLITDVQMPLMDGISLIQQLRQSGCQIPALLISAYSDFHYVRQAIGLGVEDYLLKDELTGEKLLEKLNKMCQKVLQADLNNQLLIYNAIGAMLRQSPIPAHADLTILDKSCSCLILCLRRPLQVELYQKRLQHFTALDPKQILQFSDSNFSIFASYPLSRTELLVFYEKKRESLTGQLLKMREVVFADNLCRYAAGLALQESFALLLGKEKPLRALVMEVRQKTDAVNLQYFLPGRFVHFLQDIPSTLMMPCAPIREHDITNYIAHRNSEQLICYLSSYFSELMQKMSYVDLLKSVRFLLRVFSISELELTESERAAWFTSCNGIRDYFCERAGELALKLPRESTLSRDIQNALCYIQTNIERQDLTVSDIANALQISETKLRTKFKSEMGISLAEHITQHRIEIAKQLLRLTDLKIYEIAEKVGYGSAQYLSQVFLRYTGMSPSDYKKGES